MDDLAWEAEVIKASTNIDNNKNEELSNAL